MMESGNDGGEKSVNYPGMFPRWIKRTERYDYDICSSPPVNPDGFFHLKRSTGQNSSQAVECTQSQKKREQSLLVAARPESSPAFRKTISDMEKASGIYGAVAGGKIQLQRYVPSDGDSVCSMTPESTNVYKTVSSVFLSHNNGSGASKTAPSSPAKERPSTDIMKTSLSDGQTHRFSDSDTNLTTISTQTNNPSVTVTKADDDGRNLKGLLDAALKLDKMKKKDQSSSRDPTPCSTPAVTPASSPKMGRRTGNPFFTPSSSSSNTPGSWLFRPPQQDSNRDADKSGRDNLYEKKVDVQVNPATNTVKQSVRYVPRPSKLRELNFWSPTSM